MVQEKRPENPDLVDEQCLGSVLGGTIAENLKDDVPLELKNERISELHLKKIINQSEYFNNPSEKFEIFNNRFKG